MLSGDHIRQSFLWRRCPIMLGYVAIGMYPCGILEGASHRHERAAGVPAVGRVLLGRGPVHDPEHGLVALLLASISSPAYRWEHTADAVLVLVRAALRKCVEENASRFLFAALR